MKKISKFLMAGVMSLTVLAGCGSGGGAVELNEGDTVKVGLNYELSGGTSTYGMAMDKGSRLAIKQYNEKEGHKYNIEYVSLDNKGESSESVSIATRMMTEERVAFVVGPATSTASIATYPIADQNQVPVLSSAVTQNGGMMNGDTAYEYAWRVCFEDSAQASAMAASISFSSAAAIKTTGGTAGMHQP